MLVLAEMEAQMPKMEAKMLVFTTELHKMLVLVVEMLVQAAKMLVLVIGMVWWGV